MPREKKPEPACKTVLRWLDANLPRSLGALTGTDHRALAAAVHILELRGTTGDDAVLEAFRVVVLQMQPSTREFAYHAIAHLGEWGDRARLWSKAGLEPFTHVRRCAYE